MHILKLNSYYDKTESLFDSISCNDNREWRTTWTKERLNAKVWNPISSKPYGYRCHRGRANGHHGGGEAASSPGPQD